MDDAFFAPIARAEKRHFWYRARRQVIETMLHQVRPSLPSPVRVLEIGCGTGFITKALVEIFGADAVTGLEPAGEGLRIARGHLPCKILEGDITSIDGAGPFSLVVMFDVLEHIEDEMGALDIVRRLLAPGGVLLLTVPAHQSLWSYWDEDAGHFRRYEREGLVRVLEAAGFRVEYASAIFRALYPMLRVSRWLGGVRRGRGSPGPGGGFSELRIVPVANEVLAWTLGRESARVAKRAVRSLGTSIVAIARA